MAQSDEPTRTSKAITSDDGGTAYDATVPSPGLTPAGPGAAGEPLGAGATIGRYEIRAVLGAGGMGVVYRAHDPELNRELAIKVVQPLTAGPRAQQRLLDEARAMAKLRHPNIVPVFDVGTTERGVFIVMPLFAGGTLHDWLRAAKRPWRAVLDKFVAAGRGLVAAHAAGLIHRDFKPKNVFLGNAGEVLVGDFGIAAETVVSIEPDAPAATSPAVSSVAGTPAYMAPEQAAGAAIDARADQYSYCISLWEGLHGERPGQAETRTGRSLVARALPRVPPDRRGAPAWLLAAVTRGFAPAPERRWPSMTAFLAHAEKRLRRPRRLALGAAAVVLAGGAAALAVIPGRASGDPCPDPRARLAGVWDAGVRAELTAKFAAAVPSIGADTASRVAPVLDAYASNWRLRQIESCKATHVQHSQSAALLDRRELCLERRLGALRALTSTMTATPVRSTVSQAAEAIAALPDIADCADTAALLAAQPLPASPTRRAQILAAQAELDRIQALKWAGHPEEQLRQAQALLETARALGHAPLLAEALFARVRAGLDNVQPVEALLRELAQVAADVGNDRLVALAWIDMISSFVSEQARLADAKLLEPVAEAAVGRAGNLPALRYELLTVEGIRAMKAQELDVALARFTSARDLSTGDAVADRSRRAEALHFIAKVTLLAQGPAAAKPLAEQALALYVEHHGAGHPLTAEVHEFYAQLLVVAGDFDGAEVQATQALTIRESLFGPDHISLSGPLRVLGYIANMRGKFPQARALAERSVTLRERAGDPMQLAAALGGLASVVSQIDGLPAARPHYDRALALYEKTVGKEHPSYIRAENDLAAKMIQAGDCASAAPLLTHMLAFHEAKRPDLLSLPLLLRAQCEKAERRFDEAIATLERAVAACKGCEPAIGISASATLGQVLYESGRDKARGLTLVRSARAAFAAKAMTGHVAEIDEWTKAHRVRL